MLRQHPTIRETRETVVVREIADLLLGPVPVGDVLHGTRQPLHPAVGADRDLSLVVHVALDAERGDDAVVEAPGAGVMHGVLQGLLHPLAVLGMDRLQQTPHGGDADAHRSLEELVELLGPEHLVLGRQPLPVSDPGHLLGEAERLTALLEIAQGVVQTREGIVGAHDEADPVLEELPVDGLLHEVAGTRLESTIDRLGVRVAGGDQDGDVGAPCVGAEHLAGREAVEPGHLDVQEHQVGRAPGEGGEPGPAVLAFLDLEAERLERPAPHGTQNRVVVDHECASGRLPLSHPRLPARGRRAPRGPSPAPRAARRRARTLLRASRTCRGPRAPGSGSKAASPRPGRSST